MSADNWDHCPYCLKKAEDDWKAAITKVAESYGKLPLLEWTSLSEATPTEFDPESMERTFREDYEIGLWGDDLFEVKVHYSGHCTVCGATASVKTTKLVDISPGRG